MSCELGSSSARSLSRWLLSLGLISGSWGCSFLERADAGIERGGGNDGSGGAASGGASTGSGGTTAAGGMGGAPDLFGGGCPVEPCPTGGSSSGGTASSGGSSSGGAFGTGGAASCGMATTDHDVHIVVESYEISGASCAEAVNYDFATDAQGFSLNTDEGVSGTTASSFAYCDAGLEVTLSIDANGKAEVRHSIANGAVMNGCTLNATVRLISDAQCGLEVGLQMYSGTMGDQVGDSHSGGFKALTPDTPTQLTFQLPAFTTNGSDASYGVTFERGDLTCN